MKTYLVIRLRGTDEDFEIVRMTRDEIRDLAREHAEEIAIIDGEIVKSQGKRLDIGRLK